ncbi:hypothetical protein BD414DRAFT_493945 [Trametes punicea]|nr:hypothetical protein BD414DRAFT_493945 [Trametes punicea]
MAGMSSPTASKNKRGVQSISKATQNDSGTASPAATPNDASTTASPETTLISSEVGDAPLSASSSTTGAPVRQGQPVYIQYRTHIWIPGTIVHGPFYNTLFQCFAFEVEFFEVDGTRARKCFWARDVRPRSPF